MPLWLGILLTVCNVDHSHSVRAFLAAEAESRELGGLVSTPSHEPTNPGGGTLA